MVTDVKVHDAGTTVREMRALFADEHVHAAVIVEDGRLLAVVDRAGKVYGLLCLKRTRSGFCSNRDVQARNGG
jgi:cupin superfamily acireductone dioxygenase involved in methionine salvage